MLNSSNPGFEEIYSFIFVITFYFCNKQCLNFSCVNVYIFVKEFITNNAFTSKYKGFIDIISSKHRFEEKKT